MARKNKEPLSPTMKSYKRWRNAHIALKATEYSAPFVPLGIVLGVNWNEWFPQNGEHTSVAVGLIMALASTVVAVAAIVKKDSDFMKKIGLFIVFAFEFIGWGIVCVLLSKIALELGKALICTGAGLIATATADVVDKSAINNKYLEMKKLVDDNGLSKWGEWKERAKIQAEYDGEKKKETVRYVPHD